MEPNNTRAGTDQEIEPTRPSPLPPGPFLSASALLGRSLAQALDDDLAKAKRNRPTVNERVQKHRDALRQSGLRPVQIWVPDTRRPDFAEECRRQCQIAAQADHDDSDMQQFMDEAIADVDGWTA